MKLKIKKKTRDHRKSKLRSNLQIADGIHAHPKVQQLMTKLEVTI